MIQEERLQKIEAYVKQKKICYFQELCDAFQVSKATIRRDLQLLVQRNRLNMVRGGASDISVGTSVEPPYAVKKNVNHEEKVRIAQKACSLIRSGETVILDSGSTILEIAGQIESMSEITVATNDLLVAGRLAGAGDVNLTVIGGGVRKGYYTTLGYFAQYALEHINADKAFIGVDAISISKGCMITNTEEVSVKKLIMKAAREKIVVCDHSKFESIAFINLCAVSDVDMIITGREIDPDILEEFRNAGINIVLA
jgi:DeoR/GlpR family transcriptional regulator of sugar metabolism